MITTVPAELRAQIPGADDHLLLGLLNLVDNAYERGREDAITGLRQTWHELHPESPAPGLVGAVLEYVSEDETDIDDDLRCVYAEIRAGILAKRMESPASSWIDFSIGEPERVLIGAHLSGPGASYIEVIIDGTPINEFVGDIWTLDNLRQLRDDLTALLNDDRLVGACQEAAA
jgi:hypothetical protein